MTDLWSFSWSQVVKVEHTKLTTESFPLALITTVILTSGCFKLLKNLKVIEEFQNY